VQGCGDSGQHAEWASFVGRVAGRVAVYGLFQWGNARTSLPKTREVDGPGTTTPRIRVLADAVSGAVGTLVGPSMDSVPGTTTPRIRVLVVALAAALGAVAGASTDGVVGGCVCAFGFAVAAVWCILVKDSSAHMHAEFALSARYLDNWHYDTFDTAEQAARALHAIPCNMCVELGRDPQSEVVLRSPEDNAHNGTGARYWFVGHALHPYVNWASDLELRKAGGRWGHVQATYDGDVLSRTPTAHEKKEARQTVPRVNRLLT
jgi:hypothetical protein